MTIKTRDFGPVELDEKEFVRFVQPVFGFEDLTQYALLCDDQADDSLLWLQSVERPAVCFVLLDPARVGLEHYTPTVAAEVAELLDLQGPPAVRVIAVVPQDFKEATVNLKSPILINTQNKKAAQVILDADYPVRMRLFGGEG